MDDLKLYSSTSIKLNHLLHITEAFSRDIQMDFGIDKCKTQHITAGKRQLLNFELEQGNFINSMDENETYKYLGFQQNTQIKHTSIKQTLITQYLQRIRSILKTKLHGRNTIKAINTYATPVLTYSFGTIRWTNTDLEQIQRNTRTLLTKHHIHHPHSSTIRLYLPRSQGGRGLTDIKLLHQTQIHNLRQYFYNKSDISVLHKTITYADKSYTPLNLHETNILPPTSKLTYITNNIQIWNQKPLHGRFPQEVNQDCVDSTATHTWLSECDIFPETEGFMLAIQDQVINTRNYKKHILKDKTLTHDSCRLCSQTSETIQHIISACTRLAQTEYKHRHDQVAKIIHQKLALKHDLTTDNTPHYKYTPQIILENHTHKLYWDRTLLTDKTIHHNRPDITLIDKIQKAIYIIDIAIPNTNNLTKTHAEKHRKYTDIALELKAQWRMRSTVIVPIILSATGVIPKTIHHNLQILGLDKNTYKHLLKAVIINTCHIVRKFLNITQGITYTHDPQDIHVNNTTGSQHDTQPTIISPPLTQTNTQIQLSEPTNTINTSNTTYTTMTNSPKKVTRPSTTKKQKTHSTPKHTTLSQPTRIQPKRKAKLTLTQ